MADGRVFNNAVILRKIVFSTSAATAFCIDTSSPGILTNMNSTAHKPKILHLGRKLLTDTFRFGVTRLRVYAVLPLIGLSTIATAIEQIALTNSANPAQHHVIMQTESLRAVIADNEGFDPVHRPGYNGIAELSLIGPNATNLFVPLYAGLNLEHIFSGDAQSFAWHIFEPRRRAMKLVQRSPKLVELNQERTEHWPLKSQITFKADGNAIDFTYRGTPLADVWKKHGYIGVFFASYLNAPSDLSIQFIGRSRPGRGDAAPRWIKYSSPSHGDAASHRPAGSAWDPPVDEGFNITLVSGLSDFEYLYPFYFGRLGENVLILMFEKPPRENELRFAQSPTGAGTGNPAWDFVYFQRSYEIGRFFGFRGRLVYKRFTTLADIVGEYEKWSGEKVRRPD